MIVGRDEQVVALASALDQPGLSVITGGPGAGKTALARHAAHRAGRPVLVAGALSSLRTVPALPLSRAIRAAVPVDDPPLAVEAVRARLDDAVLLLDDAHWADRFTISLLPELARHCAVVVTVRLPGRSGAALTAALRHAAVYWCDLAPLTGDAAARVVRQARADLPDEQVRRLVHRCGGNPLALQVLARSGGARSDAEPLRGMAEMVAELPQADRTALAALGLLGRAAPATLLGAGAAGLVRAGLASLDQRTGLVAAAERFVAEVAAGILPDDQRGALHRRLAALVDDHGEAARHLAAAGDRGEAADRALRAADTADGEARAEHLFFAVTCLDGRADTDLVLDAAEAALDAGLPVRAQRLAEPLTPADATGRVRRAVLLSESLTRCGQPDRARAVLPEVVAELPGVDEALRARHAIALVYAALTDDPALACALAEYPLAELGRAAPPRLWAAYGAALLGAGRPGWQEAVRVALDGARAAGDLPGECAAGAVLVAGLREDCRTAEARLLATELADRAAARAAYSLEVTFRAEALWAGLHLDGISDDLLRLGGILLARATPPSVRALLVATVALAQADTGAIPAARATMRDHAADGGTHGMDRLTRWVAAEAAWLDGDPVTSARLAAPLTGRVDQDAGSADPARVDDRDLAADMARLTLAWCAFDGPTPATVTGPAGAGGTGAPDDRPAVSATLTAWAAADTAAFAHAAGRWEGIMARERVRCLLAAGESGGDLDCLLTAEWEAERAGLVLLLGRVRRVLRRRGVTRGPTRSAGPGGLSAREYEALALVGQGHGTRRIAELLGLTRNTTETYIKQAMSKLGARTRTEAAVRAAALAAAGPPDAGGPAGLGGPR